MGFSFGTKSSSSFQFGTPTATAATTQQPGGFALNSSSTTGISFGTPATSSGQAASGRFRLGGAGKLFSWKVGVEQLLYNTLSYARILIGSHL